MADVIDFKIFGDDIQVVEIGLDPGEGVRAEAGAMLYMESGIEMQTGTGGGMFSGFKRMLTGESFFITTFLYNGPGNGHVAFGAPYPGKIIPLDLATARRQLHGTRRMASSAQHAASISTLHSPSGSAPAFLVAKASSCSACQVRASRSCMPAAPSSSAR